MTSLVLVTLSLSRFSKLLFNEQIEQVQVIQPQFVLGEPSPPHRLRCRSFRETYYRKPITATAIIIQIASMYSLACFFFHYTLLAAPWYHQVRSDNRSMMLTYATYLVPVPPGVLDTRYPI